jgi:hypothetical protein
MLYFLFLKIVPHDIIVVYSCYVVLSVSSIRPFSTWMVPVVLLEYCLITFQICCLLLKICLSTSCLWYAGFITSYPPFRIPFYLVPPIDFSFREHALFYLGPYATFHGMVLLCHIEGSIITAVWTHLQMFSNSKL